MQSLDNWNCCFLFIRSNKLVVVGKEWNKKLLKNWQLNGKVTDKFHDTVCFAKSMSGIWVQSLDNWKCCFLFYQEQCNCQTPEPESARAVSRRAAGPSTECGVCHWPGAGAGAGEREWLQSTSLDSVPGHSSSPSLCSRATKTEITQAFYQTLTRMNEDKRLLKTFIHL